MKATLKRVLITAACAWTAVSATGLAYLKLTGSSIRPASGSVEAMGALGKIAAATPSVNLSQASQTINVELTAADPLMASLVQRYYPDHVTQFWEEMLIRDFFDDKHEGFFVDVGSNHYKVRSNTYYIDTSLGWHGIAIDAIAELADGYAQNRPRTKFMPMFVGEKSDEDVDFHIITSNTRLSTADKKLATGYGLAQITRKLKTASLNDLLDSQHVTAIDLLKMDIELWEPAALRGFDIDRFKPKLVVIELHKEVKEAVLDYFAKHDYVMLDRYMKWDPNGWFVPKGDLPKFLAHKAQDPLWKDDQARLARGDSPQPATAAAEHEHEHKND